MVFALSIAEGKCIRGQNEPGLATKAILLGPESNVRRAEMLEIRQSVEVWGVTTVVFLDDLNRSVGVSKVGTMATSVSDPTFYQSNEEPARIRLKNNCAIWLPWFESEVEARFERAGGGLEIIADVLQKAFDDPECFSLAFVDMVQRGSGFDSDLFTDAREQKEHLRRYLERLALRMGLQHPDIAASAALCVIEQTVVWKEAQTARLLFQCLQHA